MTEHRSEAEERRSNEHGEPLIVDGDGHTMEPDDLWTERMDRSKWGDWIPRKVIEDEYYETVYAGGTIRGGGRALQDAICEATGMTPAEFFGLLESLRVPGGYDPHARVASATARSTSWSGTAAMPNSRRGYALQYSATQSL